MNKYIIVQFILILSLCYPLNSQEKGHKWQRFSGKWEINNSTAYETRGNSTQWNYYEILEYNTIMTLLDYKNYSSIDIFAEIKDRIETPTEFMISFDVTSESQSWFYHMYAFKVTGGYWGMNKVSFIYSDRLDKTKPFGTKNNTFVKELASADCKVKYDKIYNYRVAFEGKDVVLYINEDKVLTAPFPEQSHDGRIAISSRNVKIAIDKVQVKQNEKILFEDDFNENSIYVRELKVIREPVQKKESEKKP